MLKAIRLLFIILFLIGANQQNSFTQIINELKLDNPQSAALLQFSDTEYLYIGAERNPENFNQNVTITKKNLSGVVMWKKTIEWEFDCTVNDAVLLSDRSIIIAGGARKSHESYPFIMKTNVQGDKLWARYYNTGVQVEKVLGTSDGGFLFAHYDNGSMLMKLDSEGDSIWSSKIGDGRPYGLAETSEAVYLLVDDEADDIVLSSIGSNGEILWKRIFGGPGVDQPSDVINASNGDDYLFAGMIQDKETGIDFHIGLLDCFGYINWTKSFGGPGTDLCYDLIESSDGHFIAVGTSDSFNDDGRFDFYAVKFDTYGNTLWEQTFPGADSENYLAENVFETSYGSLILAGPKVSDLGPTKESRLLEFVYPVQFELSFESDEQSLTNPPFGVNFRNNTPNAEFFDFVWHFGDGESLESNSPSVYHEYQDDGLYDVTLVAQYNYFGSEDSYVLEDYIDIKGISTSSPLIESNQNPLLNIYPNPFTDKTIVSFNNPDNEEYTIRILDQNGKMLKKVDNIRGNSFELIRDNLPSGIYFVELSGKTTSRTKMLIL